MKTLFALALALLAVSSVQAQLIPYGALNTNQFATNTSRAVSLKSGALATNLSAYGTMRIGNGTGTGSMSPLEIIGSDAGLAITSTNTVAGTESYIAAFIKDGGGTYQKIGAQAFQWTDNNTVNGYASFNVHVSSMATGVQSDNFPFVAWAKHGFAFNPPDLTSTSAPGPGIVRFNGDNNNNDNGQIFVIGATNINQRLAIGYNTVNDYSFINSYKVATGYKPLVVGPDGGVSLGIGMVPTTQLELSLNSAQKPTSSAWLITSDKRAKDNVQPYVKGLDVLLEIEPHEFIYNGKGGTVRGERGVGIIADEIEKLLPDTVRNVERNGESLKVFDSHELTYVMINAIKQLAEQNAALETRVKALEAFTGIGFIESEIVK